MSQRQEDAGSRVMWEALGAASIIGSLVLLWALLPRGGQEARLVRLPGMWIVLPLLLMLGLLVGGALIYEAMGR